MHDPEEPVDFDDLPALEFEPFTSIILIPRERWSQRYVGNNLLWGLDKWYDLRVVATYWNWGDYLGEPTDIDDIPF